MGLNKRRKTFKRRLPGQTQCVAQPLAVNYCWSMDFMRDTLYSGRVYRVFNVIDDYNREALTSEIDTYMVPPWSQGKMAVSVQQVVAYVYPASGYVMQSQRHDGLSALSNLIE